MNVPFAYLPLFVYGTLMTGQPAFSLLAPSVERSAPACIPGLVLYNIGRYPIAAPGPATLIGEVHWLREEGYANLLTQLEQYEGSEYTRQRYAAHLSDDRSPVDVWVFVGDPAYATQFPTIPSGDWRTYLIEAR